MAKAFGEQNPTQGEDAVSWQTWSDGAGSVPTIDGDADWGKLKLDLNGGEEGRSAVYDLGSATTRKFTLTENRYGTGAESAILEIRGDTSTFNQDDVSPSWEVYASPISRGWRYVQVRERTFDTYYVDATLGDDGGTGAIDDPWQTITKVNAASLNPGDHVLFKRGETWSGRITPTYSGSSGAYITIGAYGTGNRPIIDGSAYSAFMIWNAAQHHIRVENIDFANSSLVGINTVICATHDMYFYNCIFRGAAGDPWGNGFGAYAESSQIVYNITLDSCEAYGNHSSGISFTSSDVAYAPYNILITNCTAHDNGTNLWADHGIYARHGVTIEGCTCYDNAYGGGIKVNCQAQMGSPHTPIVRNNTCYGNFIGIAMSNDQSLIYNNLTYGNEIEANMESANDGTKVYFNTFVNATTEMLIRGDYTFDTTIWKNNLFIQDSAVSDKYNLRVLDGNTLQTLAGNNTFDYNVYYHNGSSSHGMFYDTATRSWTDWTGYGAEPNGTLLSAVPDFVTRYSDFHPADAGNLKGLGVAIGGYETDKDGNTRADPPTPGCYEEAGA